MGESILADLFVEDRAHEEFLQALLRRTADQQCKTIAVRVRSARGGHGRVLSELGLYQKALARGLISSREPDLVVVAIDANCQPYSEARKNIVAGLDERFRDRTVVACPAPHIERWFLADLNALARVVGSSPKMRKGKCQRDYYKAILSQAVIDGGNVPTLGGIEFAWEIVGAMDLYHAGRTDRSLKAFLDELDAHLKRL
jgi:hypothetical protein